MAVRLATKINRNIIQNLGNVWGKSPVRTLADDRLHSPQRPLVETQDNRYNVTRPRTTHLLRPLHTGGPVEPECDNDVAKKNVEMQHLQPSMLPEFFKPSVDIQVGTYPNPPRPNTQHQPSEYRRFESSKTCANVTLPLKGPKLASPFPEPVKVMESHTISDQEKAEQMLAESRVPKGISDNRARLNLPHHRNFSTQVRHFADDTVGADPEKCKKAKKKKGGCEKRASPNCKPPKSTSCDRFAYKDCTKKMAPYPSYSEACHDPLEDKPSECKMCPWKPEEHPHFKPPKKKYHTSSALAAPKTSDWVDQDKAETTIKKPSKTISKPKNKFSEVLLSPEAPEELSLYNKKKPCKKPDIGCKKEKPKPKPKPKEEKKCNNLANVVATWLIKTRGITDCSLPATSPSEFPALLGGGGCKKFPFEKCDEVKKRKPVDTGKCPKKKPRKMVPDCPADKDKCKSAPAEAGGYFLNQELEETGYLMKEGKDDKKEKKCPKVEMGTCQEAEPDDDPCGTKRKPGTLQCPGNLLKRRKKKKNTTKKKITPKCGTAPIAPYNSPPQVTP